jgi:DMSO/TMAO reductase YedYZ molybdopterin-dependent catalytic subunit
MLDRRSLLKATGALALAGPQMLPRLARAADQVPLVPGLPDGEYATATLEALPGKKPLIKLSYRPPNYETPVSYFNSEFTANDAFFVRYHLAAIPDSIDAKTWRLQIGGEAASTPFALSLDDLQKNFEAVEIAAVLQCSGNRRGLSTPHVPGVEWGVGAMGNAVWKGARLKDILAKAGLKPEAVEIVIDGADGPVLDKTPKFVKSIPVWKALDENTLIAYAMNGKPLPHFNGFPARLVIPGWTGTYWMKHIVSLNAVTKPFDGFWMKSAYRIPAGKFAIVQNFMSQETLANTPITEMVVNTLITTPDVSSASVKPGQALAIKGIAWDAGYGITGVEVSADGGQQWRQAALGQDYGRFAFRPWSFRFVEQMPGGYTVLARATNGIGQTQASSLIFNPAGYHNNVPLPLTVNVA